MHRWATSAVFALGMLAMFGAMTWAQADERRERAEALKQEAASLADQGFREEAEALQREADELLKAAARDGRELRGEERGHLEREVEELRQHLDGLLEEHKELSRTDKIDARKRVEDEIGGVKREIAELLVRIPRERREQDDDHQRELHSLRQHLERLFTKREDLARTDDLDARRRVDQQIESTQREIAELAVLRAERRGPERDRSHSKADEMLRRIEHLHRAADHLAEAGDRRLAHELRGRAEEMEHDLHLWEDEKAEDGGHDAERREILAELRELRDNVERLRDQMNELREFVEQK